MIANHTKGIALGGFMGVGKSTVGALVASQLGLPFVDLDVLLADRFGPVADQIAREGEPVFRDRERAALVALCAAPPHVLATGGGAWVDAENRAALARAFVRVVLHAPLSTLAARVGGGAGRPLWDADVAARFAARQASYADADAHVDASQVGPAAVADAVIAAWRERQR